MTTTDTTTTDPTMVLGPPNSPARDRLQLLYLGLFSLQNGDTPGDFRILHPESREQATYDALVLRHGFDPLADRDERLAAADRPRLTVVAS